MSEVGLTMKEAVVLQALVDAWNGFTALPDRRNSDNQDFAAAIHDAQRLIALRVARRCDPDVWWHAGPNKENP